MFKILKQEIKSMKVYLKKENFFALSVYCVYLSVFRWVMWVEQLIMEKERNIKIESEKIKRQRKHLKILQQVHDAAKMYIDALLEIIRRKHYSIPFLTVSKFTIIVNRIKNKFGQCVQRSNLNRYV